MRTQKENSMNPRLVVVLMLFTLIALILGFAIAKTRERKAEIAVVESVKVTPAKFWLCEPRDAHGAKKCRRIIVTRDLSDNSRSYAIECVEVIGNKGFMDFDRCGSVESLDDVDFGDGVTVVTQ